MSSSSRSTDTSLRKGVRAVMRHVASGANDPLVFLVFLQRLTRSDLGGEILAELGKFLANLATSALGGSNVPVMTNTLIWPFLGWRVQ